MLRISNSFAEYTKSLLQLNVSNEDAITELHYFWCANNNFLFHHYLAITSAIKKFQPQIIHFYAQNLPPSAPHYFEWFEDLKASVPLLQLHAEPLFTCLNNNMPSADVVTSVLNPKLNNIVMQDNTVVNSFFSNSYQNSSGGSFIIGTEKTLYELKTVLPANWKFIQCTTINFKSLSKECSSNVLPSSICEQNLTASDVCLQFIDDIFIREVALSKSSIADFIRYNFYGFVEPRTPIKYNTDVIPRIGHYVYLDKSKEHSKQNLDYSFYLSILSVLCVVKVHCVYIHGNVKFDGQYWEDLVKRNSCVHHRYWSIPKSAWQRGQTADVRHWADIIRAQIFTQYGGLHVDPDVYFIKALPEELWQYEAVVGTDAWIIAPWGVGQKFPQEIRWAINLGVCMSMPGSRFFTQYQETQKNFYEEMFTYNSGIKAVHVFEQHPDWAHLEKGFVLCEAGVCYPTWAETNEEARYLVENTHLWLRNTYALHVVYPDITELFDKEFFRTIKQDILIECKIT